MQLALQDLLEQRAQLVPLAHWILLDPLEQRTHLDHLDPVAHRILLDPLEQRTHLDHLDPVAHWILLDPLDWPDRVDLLVLLGQLMLLVLQALLVGSKYIIKNSSKGY